MASTSTETPVNQTFRDVALERFNQVKTTSKEYFDVSKNYVRENPLLSIALAGTALITSLPLFFVVGTFLFIFLCVSSVFFVVFSIMSTIAGIVLFIPVTVTLVTLVIYYSLYYLAYNTYSKVAVILSEDKEASFSVKLVGDCLIKTVKEYGEHIRDYYNKVVSFGIEKLSVLKIQELTRNVNLEGIKIKNEVIQKIRNFRANKADANPSVPEELAKKEE
ncbi:hypothetical protein BCR32DRAFT_288849 [Anaeromyces robustus]|jgi:ABC-type multidrug transport system fused ATPase/permease subunit|uniref:Uncharacterized protein n=1 Tax=Anaeromyces robustus TaxID=1754192 RepID=A0A1Y1XQT7_9FUNG|nr:hypothetical protein BCR32DRAFT_288849 [Anaeromyces robustus]|eukprot:ORX88097.1 hypothetical protein BCR32DRAFT_288849 [Anaeromyces robustus]